MTTIHTIEDLVQVLDDHPEWMEALRSRLLPRELAELPQTFARFTEEIRQFTEEMHQFVEVTKQRLDRLEAHATETNQRLDRLETGFDRMRDDLGAAERVARSPSRH